MSNQQQRITFQPSGRTVSVLPGTKVVEAAVRAGIVINTPCGGGGTCGKCRVQLRQGASDPTATESTVLDTESLAAGWRLACQADITTETVIHVPSQSCLASQHQIVATSTAAEGIEVQPIVRCVPVVMTPPTLDDGAPDLQRLEQQLGTFRIDLSLLQALPSLLQQGDYRGTAVLVEECLIDFIPGTGSVCGYGVAVDVGTTTLAGALLTLEDGRELAVTSRMNPQVAFGDDVLARIQRASERPEARLELQHVIIQALNEMIDDLCAKASIERRHIYEVTLAGNTTMQHLLCGLDAEPLGQVPFVPSYGNGLCLEATSLGLRIHPRGRVYVFPVMGGFVGGDTVAGCLAAELDAATDPILMIDIGTNGEIALAHQGQLWVASTAAGPAFEGARIQCGMRATTGAIEKVLFNDDVTLNVIGNADPIGICGSALIDLVAELLRVGLVDTTGRLLPSEDHPRDISPALSQRVTRDSKGKLEFFLAANQALRVVLTERDIREMQLAVGAIRAGMLIMIKDAGLTVADLDRVLVAGGFGVFIRRDKAQAIGLLPPGVPYERISHIGNTALAGAKLTLLSRSLRMRGETLARAATHVELSLNPDFHREFADAMIFPGG